MKLWMRVWAAERRLPRSMEERVVVGFWVEGVKVVRICWRRCLLSESGGVALLGLL